MVCGSRCRSPTTPVALLINEPFKKDCNSTAIKNSFSVPRNAMPSIEATTSKEEVPVLTIKSDGEGCCSLKGTCLAQAQSALSNDDTCCYVGKAEHLEGVPSQEDASHFATIATASMLPVDKSCRIECCSTKAPSLSLRIADSIDTAPCCSDSCIDRRTLHDCQSPPIAVDISPSQFSTRSDKPCKDEYCGSSKPGPMAEVAHAISNPDQIIDLEKGTFEREHVILSISGMTCTGCETKLKRTLDMLPYVSNLKTSLVLARAEFELDMSAASAEDVLKHLGRTTEFKCEHIKNQDSSLDLICPSEAAAFTEGSGPDGVLRVSVVNKNTIRVEYDPKIVGSRDLLEKGWSVPMLLAPLRTDPALDASNKHVWNMGQMTLLSTALTIPVLILAWAPLPPREIAYSSASLALATIVQFLIAGSFYPKAIKDLFFSRTVEVDLLIVLSTSAAYIFSVISFGYMVAGDPLSTGEFFETSTLLVTLIMLGRFISALARQKAAESISIRSLQATTAILVDFAGVEKEIDVRLLQFGDVFKIMPDCAIPTDGTVISGCSEVDESMITGESLPVAKFTNSTVRAGTINRSGTLTVRLTRLPGDNTISTIASMVDEAKLSKPKLQNIADQIAGYFVPVIITLSIITFVAWIGVGIGVRKQSGSVATVEALIYAITVLIVSCPCSLGLAVPMVVVIASGVAAQRGIILKSADSIEVAYRATDVVFDKTGTLTQGELSVTKEVYLCHDEHQVKSLLLSLVGNIKHPVSSAIAAHLGKEKALTAINVSPKSLSGKGVEGLFGAKTIRVGHSRWLGFEKHPQVQAALAQGLTTLCFVIDGDLAAVYGLKDSLRPDVRATVSLLYEAGIAVHILSGDDDAAVRNVATQLSIPMNRVRSRYSPSDKGSYVQSLLMARVSPRYRSKEPIVIFCGDGTNDGVALAAATIGIHMSTGTDVAKSAADVVFMRSDLACILTLMKLSQKAVKRIMINFAWSFVYNLVAILLAAGALVNVRIPPAYAGLGELISVLPVVTIAVALRWSNISRCS